MVDGKTTTVEVFQVDAQQIRAEIGSASLNVVTLSASGERQPLLPNGSLAYVPGTTTRVDGAGFLPGSAVEVWMHSTPRLLGIATALGDGSFAQVFQVPAEVNFGGHQLRIVGTTPKGEPMVAAIGITVTDVATVDLVKAGRVTAEQADMLAVDGVGGAMAMSDAASSKVLLFLVLLVLLILAVSSKRFTLLPRRLSVQERVLEASPWLANHGASRFGVHGLGILVALGMLVSTNFHSSMPSALWVALFVAIGIIDLVGGAVAGATWFAVLVVTGQVSSLLDLRMAVIVAALGVLPIVSAELVRPSIAIRSQRTVTVSQIIVVAAMAGSMTAGLLALGVASSALRFEAAHSTAEMVTMAVIASIARMVLTARLNPSALRHARRVPVTYFVAVGGLLVCALTPSTASVSTIAGIAILVALVATLTAQSRIFVAPRILTAITAVSISVLVLSAGVIRFGSSGGDDVPLSVDAVEVDSMVVIGETSAFVDGIPHIFVAGSVRPGEVVYANGALGMTLTISSQTVLGEPIPLGSNNEIQLIRGQKVGISGMGFAPEQDVNAWLFSDPVLVGNTSTNSVGLVKDSFSVPSVVHSGTHTLQIRLVAADGKLVNFGIPVVVIDEMPGDNA